MSGMNGFLKLCIAFLTFCLVAVITGWVTLIVITAGGDITVPSIIGKDLKAALGSLQSEKLYLVLDGEEFHADAPRGAVIAQNPVGGEVRKAFSSVRVILSAGPDRLEMPDYRGFGIRQARHEIQNLGIGAFKEIFDFHSDYAEGEIIAHIPGPGEVIIPGSDATFLVSKGKQQLRYRMPDLIGLTSREASSLLQKFASQLEIIVSERRDFGPGIVIDQSPAAGHPLSSGNSLTITVTADADQSAAAPSLFTWKVPAGFLSKNLIMTYTIDEVTEILLEREVEPAEEMVLYVPNTGKGVFEISLDGEIVHSEVR